jgi:hypothetical protein
MVLWPATAMTNKTNPPKTIPAALNVMIGLQEVIMPL